MPKLCRSFYELLAFMLDQYANYVAALPAPLFASLMRSLQWGLDSPVDRPQTQRLCLQVCALRSLPASVPCRRSRCRETKKLCAGDDDDGRAR
eukprot:SAG11_NODE_11358_length_766_cov_1.041979_1_plen_92_part_10